MKQEIPQRNENKKILIIAYLLGALHIIFGATKLLGQSDSIKEFTEIWQFPLWFFYFVGITQLIGGLGLLIKRLRLSASLGLAYLMLGAIGTAIVSRQYINIAICFVILLLCMIVYIHCLEELTVELDEYSEKKT